MMTKDLKTEFDKKFAHPTQEGWIVDAYEDVLWDWFKEKLEAERGKWRLALMHLPKESRDSVIKTYE